MKFIKVIALIVMLFISMSIAQDSISSSSDVGMTPAYLAPVDTSKSYPLVPDLINNSNDIAPIFKTKYVHDTIFDIDTVQPAFDSSLSMSAELVDSNVVVQKQSDVQATNYVYSYKLSIVLIAFATLVILLSSILMWHKVPASAIMKVFGAVVVLIGGLILVVAGFSNDQITPVIGLFGTALGYLMSKGTSSGDK